MKDKSPQSSIIFVWNKVDIEATGPVDDNDDDDDDDDDEEDEEDEDNERDRSSEIEGISEKQNKEEVVFNQLKSRDFITGESSKTCDLFHTISANSSNSSNSSRSHHENPD